MLKLKRILFYILLIVFAVFFIFSIIWYHNKNVVRQSIIDSDYFGIFEIVGISERIVKADFVTWSLHLHRYNDEIFKAYRNMVNDLDVFRKYLIRRGFNDSEINILDIDIYIKKVHINIIMEVLE